MASNDSDAADERAKLLVIGNSCVGKTTLMRRYCNDDFQSVYKTTIGIDFLAKKVLFDGKSIHLQIWDTAGQEKYRSIVTAYFKEGDAAIILYDITNEQSFKDVEYWASQARTHCGSDVQLVLVGAKCDMTEKRVVSSERGKKLAEKLDAEFFESSAKENKNIDEIFDRIVEKLFCSTETSESAPSKPTGAKKPTGTIKPTDTTKLTPDTHEQGYCWC